jgi:hypothetical protein
MSPAPGGNVDSTEDVTIIGGGPAGLSKQLVRQLAKQMEQYSPRLSLGAHAIRADRGRHRVFSPKKFDKASPEAGYGRGESNSPLPALR